MSKSKIKLIVTIFVVLAILGAILGGIGYFSNGFKNWNFKETNKPTVEEPTQQPPTIVEKQIVSTIIENEKYGTFELPKNYMSVNIINQNMCFANNTNFNYIIEENKELLKSVNLDFNFDDFYFAMLRTENCHNSADYFGGEEITILDNTIYKFQNNTLNFNDKTMNYDIETYGALIPVLYRNNVVYGFMSNFLCKEISIKINDIYEIKLPAVITSDKGCPLTDYIFDEIMADSTTKIIYNYAD